MNYSPSAIHIKSYFNSNDIRRFELELSPNGSYKRLIERLSAIYTDLESRIYLSWLDEEKDLIGFTSDADLDYAVKYQVKFLAKKKKICFWTNKSSEPLLKIYVFNQKNSFKEPADQTKRNTIGQKLSGMIKKVSSEEVVTKARKSIGRDLKHIRDNNIKLLKPKINSINKEINKVESEESKEDNDKPDLDILRQMRARSRDAVKGDSYSNNESLSEGHVLEEHRVVLNSEEQLRLEIKAVQDSNLFDKETKEDKILKLNVKYYISNMLDNICKDETIYDLSK